MMEKLLLIIQAILSAFADGSVVAIGDSKWRHDRGHVRIYKNINNIWTKIETILMEKLLMIFQGNR